MYEFFDKHGKKFLAVVGSLLVLVFLMPGSMGRGSGMTRKFGKIDGVELSADDVAATQSAYAALSNLAVQSRAQQPGLGSLVPLAQAVFPVEQFGQLAAKFQQNPLLWNLLVHETANAGVGADEQQIDSILTSPNVFYVDSAAGAPIAMKDINPPRREDFKPGLRAILAVRRYFERRRESVKLTAPMIDDAMAKQTQQVRVHLATFSADKFLADIERPSDDELRAQLDAYANDAPGVGTSRNPFGFGYRIADKLRLQWIAVPQAEVARVIEASKPAEIWDEDAIIYYQQNPQQFQTTLKMTPTTSPAAAPTTRPFADAKADVLTKLRQPLVEQQQRKIINRVVQQMTVDAQRARAQGPTTQQALASPSGYGVQFGSYEYLQKLTDDVQKQFGVKLTTVNQAMPLTKIELQAIGGIGATTPNDVNSAAAMNEVTGPAYLFDLCKPLMAPADQGRLGAFDLLQPTHILRGDDAMYVARVLEAEPSHPPHGLDEVRGAVEKDVRQKLAFAKAADAAQKLVNGAAVAGGLDKVAGAPPIETSDWFGTETSDLTGIKDIDDAFELVRPIFDQLRGVQSAARLPRRTVIKRQAKGSAVAVELFDVRTKLSTADAANQKMAAMRAVIQELISPARDYQLVTDWFSVDGVSRRIGFVPDAASAPKPAGPATPPPSNPFMPG